VLTYNLVTYVGSKEDRWNAGSHSARSWRGLTAICWRDLRWNRTAHAKSVSVPGRDAARERG
jgi:hypothetical protein